jgi:hypothetical protein
MATASQVPIGSLPFELDEELPTEGLTDDTMQHMRDVQALIDAGESEENVARFIAGSSDFTPAERVIARVVLARAGLRFSGVGQHPLGV